MRRLALLGMAALLAMMTMFVVTPAAAQGEITISLGVSSFFADVYEDRIIPEFEAQNPGIKVHLKVLDGFGASLDATSDVEDYLDDAADYLRRADVLPIDTNLLRMVTRAGYLLDLAPLADTDPSLNAGDFYPAALDSFRWDGGLWALPVTVDVVLVFFDRQAFDEAGLSYPNANWMAADYANAIRVLTELDGTGTPTDLAVQMFDQARRYFFASFAGDVLDDSVLPNVPDYSNPVLYDVADEWIRLNQEKYLTPPSQLGVITIGGDQEPVALNIGQSSFTLTGPSYADRVVAVPLPGNQTFLTASGYGVSAGTRHPEAAYALAKFLSSSPDVAALNFQGLPARRNVTASTDVFGGMAMRLGIGTNHSAETQAAINAALETARPASAMAFSEGLEAAMLTVLDGTTTIEAALQEQEAAILATLTAAETRRATPLVVDAPPAPVQVAEGEIVLRFAVSALATTLHNEALWQQLASEFAAQDPLVGAVTVTGELPFSPSQVDLNAEYDCYISSNNPVTSGQVLDTIRSLDPLLQSDMAFSLNDLYPGVISQLQRDGQTWGMPLAITPDALDFNPQVFQQAGLPFPSEGWTVSDFELALRTIYAMTGEAPFKPSALSTTHLATLIAAYGGLPYDTRTTPATLNYNDPATVTAIQQVLDLIIAGYITYEPFTGGGRGPFSMADFAGAAISTASVGVGGMLSANGGVISISVGGPQRETEAPARYYAPYPTGTTMNGASYQIVAGFISAQSANVEPCYRWLRFVSQHPEVFDAMPVSRALVSNPALDTAAGPENAAFYRGFGALLDSPMTHIIDAIPPSLGLPTETYWLLKTMDAYIESGGTLDLAAALDDAQTKALEFRACAPDMQFARPGGGPAAAPADFQARAQATVECAISVDPDSAGDFQF